jgi:multicomponent Na+:H+ antiporter subunit D
VHTHRENVSEMGGIGRQMPITMAAFTLASLSMAGIPPFVIFGSKWLLGSGAAQVDQTAYLIVYMVSGVLSAAYLFPIVYRAYWRPSVNFPRFSEAPVLMVAPLSLTALLALAWGLVPDLPFSFLSLATSVADAMDGAK